MEGLELTLEDALLERAKEWPEDERCETGTGGWVEPDEEVNGRPRRILLLGDESDADTPH